MAGQPPQIDAVVGGADAEAVELDRRLAMAFMAFNSDAHEQSTTGTLIQAWRPKTDPDGSVYLETKGLPLSIYGTGDMLAHFRYLCCGRRFSADVAKAELMGAVGRVFASGKPEFCGDVQKVREPAFLRGKDVVLCNLHSICVLPVFSGDDRSQAVAVVELVWHDKDVAFAQPMTRFQTCLEEVGLHTAEIDFSDIKTGLMMLTPGKEPTK